MTPFFVNFLEEYTSEREDRNHTTMAPSDSDLDFAPEAPEGEFPFDHVPPGNTLVTQAYPSDADEA